MDTLNQIASAFDVTSVDYDAEFGTNRVGVWMRKIVWEYYLKYLKPGSSVLELNCGTGIDAVFLAKNGIRVLATDVSPGMIARVDEKVIRENLSGLIKTKVRAIEDISHLEAERFDGIVSNFGGMNCVADLRKVSEDCHARLKERGVLLVTLMSRTCLWEMAVGLLKGNLPRAFRRMRKAGVYANIGGERVRIFYHSPRTFCRRMAQHFQWKETVGLAIFIPSPYMDHYYLLDSKIANYLGKLDRRVERIYPFRNVGDHHLITLVKR